MTRTQLKTVFTAIQLVAIVSLYSFPGAFMNQAYAATAPIANNDSASTNVNTPVTVNVLANDTDPDGDAISIESYVTTTTNGGRITKTVGEQLRYTPATGFVGTDTFTYVIEDSKGLESNTATVTVTITASGGSCNITAEAIDAGNDSTPNETGPGESFTLVWSTTGDTQSRVTINSSNDARFNGSNYPTGSNQSLGQENAPNNPGTYTYNFSVTCGDNTTKTASANFRVVDNTPQNRAPIANNDSASTNVNTPVTVNVLANDTDPDGDAISIESYVTTTTNGGRITKTVGEQLRYTPATGFVGTDTFTYVIEDSKGLESNTATVTVTMIDPTAGQCSITLSGAPSPVNENSPLILTWSTSGDHAANAQVQLRSTDDPRNAFNFNTANVDGSSTNGAPTVTADRNFIYRAAVNCQDGSIARAETTVRVLNVVTPPQNRAPIANNDSASTNVNTPVTVNVLANDTDPDGDAISIESYVTTTTNGGRITKTVGEQLRYTPATGFVGTDTFTYVIEDSKGLESNTATVTVTMIDPTAGQCSITLSGAPSPVNENSPLILTWSTSGDHAANAQVQLRSTDDPRNAFNFNTANVDGSSTNGAPTVTADRNFIYRAAVNCQDGSIARAETTVRVLNVVTPPQNRAPIANNDSASTNVNTPVTVNVLANDTDPDGDAISIESYVTTTTNGGRITKTVGEQLRYTPATGFVGTDTFTYVIEDSKGLESNTATVTVVVNQPSACSIQLNDDPYRIKVGDTVTRTVTDNDTIPGTAVFGDNNPSGNAHVTFSDNDGPTYTFTGVSEGSYSFNYQVACSDGRNPQTANVSIIVERSTGGGSCSAVSAINDSRSNVTAGSMILVDVLDNDSTGSNDLPLTIESIISGPANGNATVVSNKIQYQSDSGFKGTDTIVYRAENDCGNMDEATLTISVGNNNGGGGGGGGILGPVDDPDPEPEVRGDDLVNLDIFNERLTKISDSKYVITWNTNIPTTSQVVYGMRSVSRPSGQCGSDLGYQQKTRINSNRTTTHVMVIDGLTPGAQYFFRPVSDRDDTDCEKGRELTHRPVNVCEGYIRDFMRIGQYNDPREVAKLQAFLRIFEGYNVRLTGVFDAETDRAVKDFQLRYYDEVLAPWGYDRSEATGYVYITTRNKINEIICDRDIPFASAQLHEIANFRSYWNNRSTVQTTAYTPVATQPIDRDTTTKSINCECEPSLSINDDRSIITADDTLMILNEESDEIIITDQELLGDTDDSDQFFLDTVIDGNQEKSAERELGEKTAGAAVLSGVLSFIFSLPFLLTVLGILVLLLIYEVLKDRKNKKQEDEVVVVETVPTPNNN